MIVLFPVPLYHVLIVVSLSNVCEQTFLGFYGTICVAVCINSIINVALYVYSTICVAVCIISTISIVVWLFYV